MSERDAVITDVRDRAPIALQRHGREAEYWRDSRQFSLSVRARVREGALGMIRVVEILGRKGLAVTGNDAHGVEIED